MADPQIPKYLASVTLTSANNALVIDDGSGAHTVSITAGTYYVSGDDAADDLLKRIKTDFDTASSGHGTWTVALASNVVTFSCNTSSSSHWHVDFSSGSTTFTPAILGATSIDVITGADAATTACPYRSQYLWVPDYPVASDTFQQGKSPVSQSQAKSGRNWTVKQGTATDRRIVVHENEPFYNALPLTSATYTNRDFQGFWEACNDGRVVRYYPDNSVSTVFAEHSNPKGYYVCVLDEESCAKFEPARYSGGVAYYSWTLGLHKYV